MKGIKGMNGGYVGGLVGESNVCEKLTILTSNL